MDQLALGVYIVYKYTYYNELNVCERLKRYFLRPQKLASIVFRIKGMWYLRKATSSREQFGPVCTCLCPKCVKFYF